MQIEVINQMLTNPSQVAWACRRGMLELDVILTQYFNTIYPGLSQPDKIRFITLLDCNDMELFAWLVHGTDVDIANKDHQDMVNKIREHARFRISS